MDVQVTEEPITSLAQLAHISIAFTVERVLDVKPVNGGLGGLILTERVLDTPYTKDYDAIEGEGPTEWARQFDVTNWGLIVARSESRMIGAAAVAQDTSGMDMLEGRNDLAVLWDLRVAPEFRGQGIGSALFKAAETWAIARGCRQLKVETQNVNVPACRFYVVQGCVLGAINRFAYPSLPDEALLLWYKEL